MADTPSSPAASEPENRAAEQARIRKERREAKIRAGGSARLDRITGLGGGIKRDAPPQPSHGDPDEVDISEHFYQPVTTRRSNASPAATPNDDQLRQMMLGFDPASMPQPQPGANPFAGFPGMEGMGGAPGANPFAGLPGMDGAGGPPGAEDPMMKMMMQMMGGMGGPPGEGADGMPSFPGMPPATEATSSAYIWRIIHAVFALALGVYIASTTSFTGSRVARLASSPSLSPSMVHFFYIFATTEVLLQTSRFFMEKGRAQQSGILGMVINFLPEPYKGYLGLASRYFRIWTTVSEDAMVLVFVLGICAWARST